MKILMVNYEFPPWGGGAGQAHYQLLRQYALRPDLRVDVLTSGPGRGLAQEDFADGITIYKIGIDKKNPHYWRKKELIIWMLRARKRYSKLLDQNEYDLVHAFFGFPSGWLCYRSADKLPYLISLRGSDVPGINPRFQRDYKILAPVFRRIWRRAALLAACSEGLRQRALNFLPTVDIEVIANGVDGEKFKPAERKIDLQGLRLLTVGRLSASKRVELLIEAVGQLQERFTGVSLTIAGGGVLQEDLERMVKQKQLQDVVKIMGRAPAEQMPQLYQKHDILISATAQEGMSNAMLEAMACGLPIITTRCEGVEELITDNGVIVEQPTAEALAGAVERVIQEPQRYEEMAAAGHRRARLFTWAAAAEQYIKCYEKIITPI
ncbi:glycosyltransferase family 4 protein [Planctomycetota bacterium]